MTSPSQRTTVGALTAVSLGLSLIVGCVIVAARVLSLIGLRSLAVCGVGGGMLFAIVCVARTGTMSPFGGRIAMRYPSSSSAPR